MAFCGCSLFATVVTAGVCTVLDCLIYLIVDIFILIALSSETAITFNDKTTQHFINGFYLSDNRVALIVLFSIRVVTRLFWLFSVIFLFRGNGSDHRRYLYVWELATLIRIVFAVGAGIYSLVKFVNDLNGIFDILANGENVNEDAIRIGKSVATLFVFFDLLEVPTLGPIWIIILIALTIYVYQRGHEIRIEKSNNRFNWDNSQNHNGINNYGFQPNHGPLTNPMSLSQGPNRLNATALENHTSQNPLYIDRSENTFHPNIEVNDAITIPRVVALRTQEPPKDYDVKSNIKSFESKALERKVSNNSAISKRATFGVSDPNRGEGSRNVQSNPLRNTYYFGQNPLNPSQQRNDYAYQNRAYDASNGNSNVSLGIRRAKLQ